MEAIARKTLNLGCTTSSLVTLNPHLIMMIPHLSLAASSAFINRLCEGESEKTKAKVIKRILAHESFWFTAMAIEYFPDWIIEIARAGQQADRFKEAQEWIHTNGFRMMMSEDRSHLMWETSGVMICLGSIWVEKNDNVIEIHSS